jgi:hypothetical protein
MFRPILTAGLAFFVLASVVQGQAAEFLSTETASGDAAQAFERRLSRVEPQYVALARAAEHAGWKLYRAEFLRDVAGYIFVRDVPADARKGDIEAIVSSEGGWRVRFVRDDGQGGFAPVADVSFASIGSPRTITENLAPLTEEQVGLARAQKLVGAQEPFCEDRNVVLALPSPEGGIWVYRLREPAFSERLPLGQHVRYSVDAQGQRITGQRDFSSCQTQAPENRGNESIYSFTARSDNTPTEMHVFLALRYNKPLYIFTLPSNMAWRVEDGSISVDR